jgi:drug/metabolite transporter (DMT)-like permease
VQRKTHLDLLAVVLLVACCVLWALQQILIKLVVAEMPPLVQASLRFGGATLLLLLWCTWRGVPLLRRDGTLRGGLLAGLLFAAEFTCIYIGMLHTSASRLTVFLYTSPFVVALLLPRFVKEETLRRVQWVGLALAFAAVALAFSEGLSRQAPGQLYGDALGLGGGLFWGLTTLVIRGSRLSTASAEKTLFYQVATTAVVAPLLSRLLGEPLTLDYSATAWAAVAFQAVVGAFGTFLVWMWMLRHYPATVMSSFTFLTPVFALLLGVGLLDEPLTPQLLLAVAGVAVGIVLVSKR